MALPEPKSRKEQYLATAAGMAGITLPEPASREEEYLNAIAEGGGGGGGYELPIASADTLGGVKVGSNLSINESGVLSAEGGGPTVVQTTGTSTTNVMSQNAVTSMVYKDPGTCSQIHLSNTTANMGDSGIVLGWNSTGTGNKAIAIGATAVCSGGTSVAIGRSCTASGSSTVAVGSSANATKGEATAIGCTAHANGGSSLALGAYSTTSNVGAVSFPYCNDGGAQGVVNFGPFNSSYGYDNTNTRLLTGVHNGVNANDAVTVGQLSSLITAINSALGTSITIASGVISNSNANNNSGVGDEDPSDPSANPGGEEPAPDDMEAPGP